MNDNNISRIFAIRFVLAAVLLLCGGVHAGAQEVQFTTVQPGNRRVVLKWNRAPSDTLSREDRVNCRALCGACCKQSLFGGYQIWRGNSPDPSKMVLLRTYAILDTTWTFSGNERAFVDPDSFIVRGCADQGGFGNEDCLELEDDGIAPFNGFPYYYAVSYFSSKIDTIFGGARIVETEMQSRAQGLLRDPVLPTSECADEAPVLGRVSVVPNPFDPSDEFGRASFGSQNRIQFINLPCPAKVSIYTTAGDFVTELESTELQGSLNWDLRNQQGEDVVGGIYMFLVETDEGRQSRSGHFVIIR